jgi:Tfp pilus assembly protein PilF
MFLVGWIYLKQNDTTKAKEALQAAIQAEPNGPHAMKAVQLVSKLQ